MQGLSQGLKTSAGDLLTSTGPSLAPPSIDAVAAREWHLSVRAPLEEPVTLVQSEPKLLAREPETLAAPKFSIPRTSLRTGRKLLQHTNSSHQSFLHALRHPQKL